MARANDQGKALEQLVAWLHEAPGVTVEQNVRLPVVGGKRRREFDVLLTTSAAGYLIRLVIECKNEREPIGASKVDAFRGKLESVGIPPSLGIFVSTSGYTAGARLAAKTAGIKAFIFGGLSADQLSLEISRALQSIVVLLPWVTGLELHSEDEQTIEPIGLACMLYDDNDQLAGEVPDGVWRAWRQGDIALKVGPTSLQLEDPERWHLSVDGRRFGIQQMVVRIEVVALVVTLEGEAHRARLMTDDRTAVVRERVHGRFAELAEPGLHTYALKTFRTEADLHQHLSAKGLVHVVHYLRSPRVGFWNMLFWPPSERATEIIATQMQLFLEGRIPDPRPFSFEQVEGTDLKTAWEPIPDEYLAERKEFEAKVRWRAA